MDKLTVQQIIRCGLENLRMSGCPTLVPAMSGIEDLTGERVKFCLHCNDKLPCSCIWEAVRSLQEEIKGLHAHIDKLHEMVNVEDRITASDVLTRLTKLESSKLSQELDPKVWVFVNERLDKLESEKSEILGLFCSLELQVKAKQFKDDTDEGNRYIECMRGIENKLQNQIDEANMQFKSIYGKLPHKCPVCDGCGRLLKELAKVYFDEMQRYGIETVKDCNSCEGKGIVWG